MLLLCSNDLADPILVWKRELDRTKSGVCRLAETLEERHFVEEEREVCGEAWHVEFAGARSRREADNGSATIPALIVRRPRAPAQSPRNSTFFPCRYPSV